MWRSGQPTVGSRPQTLPRRAKRKSEARNSDGWQRTGLIEKPVLRHVARPVPIQLPLFADAASLIRVRPERNECVGRQDKLTPKRHEELTPFST